MNKLILKLKRSARKINKFFVETPSDIVSVGVISSLVGRTMLYGAFAVSFLNIGIPVYAALFMLVISLDIGIHTLAIKQIGYGEIA